MYKVIDIAVPGGHQGLPRPAGGLQTTLRTSQLNYYSALFQVLTSKVELLRTRARCRLIISDSALEFSGYW
ncbi:MAG: hypothetical protein WKG07_36400 [Hymenobacter sp.]